MISGMLTDAEFQVGDCFELYKPQPYTTSRSMYSGELAFYTPFPTDETYSVTDSTISSLAVSRLDDSTIEVKITEPLSDPATLDFSFTLNSLQNPYSQMQTEEATNIDIRFLKQCD